MRTQLVEVPATMTNRNRCAEMRRLEEAIERRLERLDQLHAEHAAVRDSLAATLGVAIPPDQDGHLYDILVRVEPMPDGGWRWLGGTNNKGLPVYRVGTSERSIPRYLCVVFGLIDPDWQGILYPAKVNQREPREYVDVNPWHRVARTFPPGYRRGNPHRFDATRLPDARPEVP